MRISLLVPTRARPDQVRFMWESARETADDLDALELVLYVDDDDPNPVDVDELPGDVTVLVGRRIVLSEMWNQAAASASGELLWHGNDDIRFRTPGWDSIVVGQFDLVPDRIVFAHGNDGIQGQAIGTHGFLHRRWVDTVGYMVPPYFSSDYNDAWLTEVADLLGRRRYLPELDIEHLHPLVGKGEWDQTHKDRLARHARDQVDDLYVRLAPERHAWAEQLRAVMG